MDQTTSQGKTRTANWRWMTALVVLAICLSACARQSYIHVGYQLPASPNPLPASAVFVETRDLRSDTTIFNPDAKADFENFTGLFALALRKPDETSRIIGAYALPMLFETALKRRLQQYNISIASDQAADTPLFLIQINQFQIHLEGRKWLANVSYEVTLSRDDRQSASETVSGSAERIKLLGSGGAEKVVGEIFTEMINRLDIERLFSQAGL